MEPRAKDGAGIISAAGLGQGFQPGQYRIKGTTRVENMVIFACLDSGA